MTYIPKLNAPCWSDPPKYAPPREKASRGNTRSTPSNGEIEYIGERCLKGSTERLPPCMWEKPAVTAIINIWMETTDAAVLQHIMRWLGRIHGRNAHELGEHAQATSAREKDTQHQSPVWGHIQNTAWCKLMTVCVAAVRTCAEPTS